VAVALGTGVIWGTDCIRSILFNVDLVIAGTKTRMVHESDLPGTHGRGQPNGIALYR
jgi:hypothetical protein